MVATPSSIRTKVLLEGARSPDRGGSTWREEFFAYGRSSDRRDTRNRYRFIGVERDEDTGLCMTGPRSYDPVSGRFLQGDPVVGGAAYVYSRGNPVSRMDGNGYNDCSAVDCNPEAFASPSPLTPDPILAPMPEEGAWAKQHDPNDVGQDPNAVFERQLQTNKNIAGGLFGAIGYWVGGDAGSDFGAVVDANAAAAAALGGVRPWGPGPAAPPVDRGTRPAGAAPGGRALNLGAGSNPMTGATNVDPRAAPGIDVLADAAALPFRSGTFSDVHSINPYGFNPVSAETARVMSPGGLLRVTGTARNPYAAPLSADAARAAGFEVLETTPMQAVHDFGVQRLSSGVPINTSSSTTTVYRRLP